MTCQEAIEKVKKGPLTEEQKAVAIKALKDFEYYERIFGDN